MTLAERIRNGMHPGSPAIPLREIIIQGNTLVGSKTLDKAMESFTGKDLTFEDLGKILATLDQKYQSSGYPTSKAIIPPQPLDSGRLLIDVREVRDSFSPKDIQVHAKDNVRIAARVAPKPVASHYLRDGRIRLREQRHERNGPRTELLFRHAPDVPVRLGGGATVQ